MHRARLAGWPGDRRDVLVRPESLGVAPNTPNSLGNLAVDAFVNAAILKINSDYGFDDVVPSTDYTDGTISFDWPRY